MSDMTFASLSPTLLARKGGAKPAMRRQSIGIAGSAPGAVAPSLSPAPEYQQAPPASVPEDALEDLGWNDLGEDRDEQAAEDTNDNVRDDTGDDTAAFAHSDDSSQEPAKAEFAPLGRHSHSTSAQDEGEYLDEHEHDSSATITPIRKGAPRLPRPKLAVSNAAGSGGQATVVSKRTAFTLRLDPQRHLKLRMASTLAGRSAQSLVTEAVDAMFADIPELDALVARMQSRPQQEG